MHSLAKLDLMERRTADVCVWSMAEAAAAPRSVDGCFADDRSAACWSARGGSAKT